MDYGIWPEHETFAVTRLTARIKLVPGLYSKKSALYIARNAIAQFTVASNQVSEDANGNIVVNTETLTYDLYVRNEITDDRELLPGANTYSNVSSGYAVFPSKLDPRIKIGSKGIITYAGQPPSKFVVIDARFNYGDTGLIGSSLQDILGDSIAIEEIVQS